MRKCSRLALISILFLFLSSIGAFAAGKQEADDEEKAREMEKALFMAAGAQDRVLKIGLVDCIAYALKNNSEILIKRIEPKIKESDVNIARAAFEPIFSAGYTLRSNAEESSNTLYPGVSKTRDINFNAGASGRLMTGMEYGVDFLNERYKSGLDTQSPNPYYTTEPRITITQPLFRDFGVLVNTADITVARNNKKQSQEAFRDTVMDTISKAKISFYSLMYNRQNYAIAQSSLLRARDLLEINRARYGKGLASSVDLLETETAVAQRERLLISAESNVKRSEDELKLITNLVDDPETWNAQLEFIDDKPQFKEEKADLLDSLKNAFEFRPDYKSSKIDLKNRDIKIITAKNALLPTVDLVASFGLNGLGKDYQDAVENIDSDTKDWSVGFKVSVPWGGAERAKLDQRKLEKAQALLTLKRLEQKIILEVRDKVREVDIQARQVKASKLNLETEEKNYAAQKERYAAGQVSTHDMLDYQDKLAQAELDYIKALIDHYVALINLDRSQGLTLVRNDIKLEE